jgi:hypothetical protein
MPGEKKPGKQRSYGGTAPEAEILGPSFEGASNLFSADDLGTAAPRGSLSYPREIS